MLTCSWAKHIFTNTNSNLRRIFSDVWSTTLKISQPHLKHKYGLRAFSLKPVNTFLLPKSFPRWTIMPPCPKKHCPSISPPMPITSWNSKTMPEQSIYSKKHWPVRKEKSNEHVTFLYWLNWLRKPVNSKKLRNTIPRLLKWTRFTIWHSMPRLTGRWLMNKASGRPRISKPSWTKCFTMIKTSTTGIRCIMHWEILP